ncbi:kinase-like domain-containing protein [Aspergillus granulosus]|uniref:Kinase-like domain-containing protein n=1 Tax=Aspergillus granulosus TaxID=176169 RepID=A0ABR4HW40_9EURO
MSFLDAASFSKSWSFLPIDFGALNNDPYRSRNTISNAQNAYIRGLYKDSRHVQNLGEGSVFKVTLRQATKGCQLYALKTAKLDGRSALGKKGETKKSSAGGVFSALKEIQVVSNVILRAHPNIVNILGWDWSQEQIPVIFVEYAEKGSLRDYLQFNGAAVSPSLKRQFARDIACGLNALHAVDIAHGDVKLLNTLVFVDVKKGLIARISDFSHSVFGLSTKRKSTYPGSSRYNAPEIRGRETIILSDQLALCEVFSFGLLVWEILKGGRPFFDGLDGGSSFTTGTEVKEDCFDYLGLDGLLQKALNFLPYAGLPRNDTAIFYHMFQITLRDRAEARSDMQVVAMALDPWDEYASPLNGDIAKS